MKSKTRNTKVQYETSQLLTMLCTKLIQNCKCFVTILPPTITQNIETTQVKGPDTKLTRTERQLYEQCTLNKKCMLLTTNSIMIDMCTPQPNA